MESNFLNWLWQKYSRSKYLGSKKSKSGIALNCIFTFNTSNTDPFVKQKKQTWTSEQVAELQPADHFWAKVCLVDQEKRQHKEQEKEMAKVC